MVHASPTTRSCRRSSRCSSGPPAALACTDLILNGTLERFPDLRIGIVELSAIWVPMYLMMLDGGYDFTTKLNGRPLAELSLRPSEYFRRQVRVSSFSYELPGRLIRQTGDLYMCCSDYPHSEGTAHAARRLHRQRAARCAPTTHPGLFRDNVAVLAARALKPLTSTAISSGGSVPWNHSSVSTRFAIRQPSAVRTKSSS